MHPQSSNVPSSSNFLSRRFQALVFLVVASLCSLAMDGCADRVAGASTETTNGLTGTVTDPAGRVVEGARVVLWNGRGDSSLGSSRTDASGRWEVPGVSGIVGIEIRSKDSALGSWRGGTSIPTSVLTRIDFSLRPVDTLRIEGSTRSRLAGTPWRSTDGWYRRVPAGSYTVLADTSSRSNPLGSLHLQPGQRDTFQVVADSGLLIEDFDDGDSTWLFGTTRSNKARWFAQEGPFGATLLPPLVAESTATPGMETLGAWRGRSLHIRYSTIDTGSFVQVGTYFIGFANLSSLRSIRLRIKGDGMFRLAVHGYDSTGGVRAVWQATPGSDWSQVRFAVGSELPAGPSDPPRQVFSKLGARTHLLMLQAYGGTELWIDDIRLDGVGSSTFAP